MESDKKSISFLKKKKNCFAILHPLSIYIFFDFILIQNFNQAKSSSADNGEQQFFSADDLFI